MFFITLTPILRADIKLLTASNVPPSVNNTICVKLQLRRNTACLSEKSLKLLLLLNNHDYVIQIISQSQIGILLKKKGLFNSFTVW